MKIVCDSCAAKYSIADEKVAGKVFKIRCKMCTSVIVVRGDQVPAEEQEAATQVFDYGSDAVWHVVIDGRIGTEEEAVEWAAFGFIFALGVLSFHDARPRGVSAEEFRENERLGERLRRNDHGLPVPGRRGPRRLLGRKGSGPRDDPTPCLR